MAVDGTAVQEHQFACKCKPQTGAKSLLPPVFAVIETVEQLLHLILRNTDAVVAYINNNVVELAARAHLKRYFAVLSLSILGCVRQQVIDDFVEFVGINPSHHALGRTLNFEVQAFLGHERLNAQGCLLNIPHNVALGYLQLQFTRLRLAGFQYLLQQPHHTVDVQLHQVVVLLMVGCS